MTRKFYEEPQILVMEMDEEEIIATSEKNGITLQSVQDADGGNALFDWNTNQTWVTPSND